MEIQMAEVTTKLEYIAEKLEKNECEHKALMDKIDKFVDSVEVRFKDERKYSDNRYADKRTEKIVWFVIGTIATVLIGAAVNVIFL